MRERLALDHAAFDSWLDHQFGRMDDEIDHILRSPVGHAEPAKPSDEPKSKPGDMKEDAAEKVDDEGRS